MRHAFVHFLPIRPFRCARQPGALLVWRWKHRGHCARALARQDTSRVSRVIRGHMNNNTCYSACDVVRPAAAPCNAALACSWPAGQSTTRAQRSAAERAKRRPPASPDRISKIAPARAPRAGPRRRWWARRAGSRAARCGARTRRRRRAGAPGARGARGQAGRRGGRPVRGARRVLRRSAVGFWLTYCTNDLLAPTCAHVLMPPLLEEGVRCGAVPASHHAACSLYA